jgi:hypothetical protein
VHVHIGFLEFFTFGLYLIIWKAALHVINVNARRNGSTTLAGVSGLLA